jgi:hypothetical protein
VIQRSLKVGGRSAGNEMSALFFATQLEEFYEVMLARAHVEERRQTAREKRRCQRFRRNQKMGWRQSKTEVMLAFPSIVHMIFPGLNIICHCHIWDTYHFWLVSLRDVTSYPKWMTSLLNLKFKIGRLQRRFFILQVFDIFFNVYQRSLLAVQ